MSKLKDLDAEEQPREKAEKYGCGVLTVPELWALILRTGTPGNPITQLCRDLMHANGGTLHALERCTRQQLRSVKGIGTTKSIQIEAVMELIKRYTDEQQSPDEPIKNSADIYRRLKNHIGNLPHEEIRLLILNRRNVIVRERKLTSGTATASLFDVKVAVKHAVIDDAESVVLVHNHPSGNLRPSEPDKRITKELKTACGYMGIRLLDHVIVTSHGFFSFADSCLL